MSTATDRASGPGYRRIDRRIGWVVALGSVLFAGAGVWSAYPDGFAFAPWWNGAGMLVAAAIALLAAAGPLLPTRMLRALWWAIPVACIVLQLLAYSGSAPGTAPPWVWMLQPGAACLLVLVATPVTASVLTVLSAASPVVSAIAFTGSVPTEIVASSVLCIGNVALILLLSTVRERLRRLHRTELRLERQERRDTLVAADRLHQRALVRLVHDDVLAVLAAATRFDGAPPVELRREATAALRSLDRLDAYEDPLPEQIDTSDAARVIAERARRAASTCLIDLKVDGGEVPGVAVAAVASACAEAVRNSVRHAGDGAHISVAVAAGTDRLEVVVADDGRGFDVAGGAGPGLGLRESIVGRMQALSGGSAQVRSTPGAGTEVELSWRR